MGSEGPDALRDSELVGRRFIPGAGAVLPHGRRAVLGQRPLAHLVSLDDGQSTTQSACSRTLSAAKSNTACSASGLSVG